jgi:WD40 repeat protein
MALPPPPPATARLLRTLSWPDEDLCCIAMAPDWRTVLTAARGASAVRVKSSDTGEVLKEMQGHTTPVNAVVVSPDGAWAVSASQDCMARVWDLRTCEKKIVLEGHTGPLLEVAVSGDARTIVTASSDGTMRLWDARTGVLRNVVQLREHSIENIAVSFSGEVVAASFARNNLNNARVCVWKGEELQCEFEAAGTAVDISRRGDKLLALGWRTPFGARLMDAATGTSLVRLREHDRSVEDVRFAPDNVFAVTASRDRTARVWDLRNAACVWVSEQNQTWLVGGVLSPNGCHMLTVSSIGVAHVWDVTPAAKLAMAAVMGANKECGALWNLLRQDGDHAVMVRVLKFLL